MEPVSRSVPDLVNSAVCVGSQITPWLGLRCRRCMYASTNAEMPTVQYAPVAGKMSAALARLASGLSGRVFRGARKWSP